MNMSDKWKQLVDLIVNEEEQKASDLFHEIVIENSRDTSSKSYFSRRFRRSITRRSERL